jgi:hypothetical protein
VRPVAHFRDHLRHLLTLLLIACSQGQYSYYPSYQGVSRYSWQTAGNAITLVAALIAAGLYGNIGIKVFYNNILMEILNAPPLITKGGKILYAIIVPIWWIIAFIIAASIPDYFGFVSGK